MILDHCRDIDELKELYKTRPMNDGIMSFDFLLNNPNLFCFYDELSKKLMGYISIYTDETKKLFLCGASVRKNMAENIKAIILVCNAFKDDMYADTDKKEAKICLLRAGFKKITNNLYRRIKNNG